MDQFADIVAQYLGIQPQYKRLEVLSPKQWELEVGGDEFPTLLGETAAITTDDGEVLIKEGFEDSAVHELVHSAGMLPVGVSDLLNEGIVQIATEEICREHGIKIRKTYASAVKDVKDQILPLVGDLKSFLKGYAKAANTGTYIGGLIWAKYGHHFADVEDWGQDSYNHLLKGLEGFMGTDPHLDYLVNEVHVSTRLRTMARQLILEAQALTMKSWQMISSNYNWNDVDDALEAAGMGLEPERELNRDDFSFEEKTVKIENLYYYDDIDAWAEWGEGELLELDEDELSDELKGFRQYGEQEREATIMDWVRTGTCPPIVIVETKERTEIGDGRGRVSIALGMGWEKIPAIFAREKGINARLKAMKDSSSEGKAKPFRLTTWLGKILQAEGMGAHSEMVTAFVSDAIDDPLDEITTNFDLDTVRQKDIDKVRDELLKGTQISLQARELGPKFDVYRYGPIRQSVPDVTAVTLDTYTATEGAEREKTEAYHYVVDRSSVLVDIEALWPRGGFAEEEFLVDPKGLQRKEKISTKLRLIAQQVTELP